MYNSLRKSFKAKIDGADHIESTLESPYANQDQLSTISAYDVRRYSEPAPSPFGSSSLSQLTPTLSAAVHPTRSRSRDRKNEPLGLHVIYEPPCDRTVDIIFVHGLGGSSRMSWSWNRDLSFFWPQEWLPSEPGFRDARVLTFGYNAHFMSPTSDIFNISDFAKDLLLHMKFGSDESVKSLNIGQVPIIFVVHSMGGLVVKKAYILGSQDPQYQQILDTVCSIVFLATPHRGSNLADILNKFLTVSFQSPKQYINDLQRNSARISDINDQFKLHAQKMQLVSFFETQPTSVGIKKMTIVERDSAILDYPNEISSPLNADHHNVCKYRSRSDANYVSVRNVVKSLVEKFKLKGVLKKRRSVDQESTRSFPSTDELMSRLGVAPKPSDTLDLLLEQYVRGSCDWIISEEQFVAFMADESTEPSVLHITGRPGSGKSMMASFLIQHLESQELPTQFWYFRHDDQLKRSNRQALLSLAFQILSSFPEYSHRLLSLSNDINSIARSDIRSLWQKMFLSLLDKLGGYDPIYWVIDAVDESESAQVFLGLLGSLKGIRFPLRIIFLTRSQTVTKHFDKLKTSLPQGRVSQITISTPDDSLRLYISERLESTPWPDNLKEIITTSLLQKAQGSFLWLSLVLRELVSCDTEEQLEEVLEETPEELIDIYDRIEKAVVRDLRPADTPLLKAILSWVACSERQLTEDELKEALKPNFSVLNLKYTISRLCGDFVVVDKKGRVSMVHYTAKEFLMKTASSVLAVNSGQAHAFILDKCITVLTDPRFRLRLKSQGCTGLLRYCCLSWSHHMAQSDIQGHGINYLRRLAAFFKSTACLAWIDAVATTGQLNVLASTAKALTSYVQQTQRMNIFENPLTQPLLEMEYLNLWSAELVRVMGKFGTHLLRYPSCIYSLVPLFCPPTSAIGQNFAATGPFAPRVTGISNTGWDDSLAKFTIGQGQRPKSIFCLDSSFGILSSDKSVNLYDASTFHEIRRFRHEETIVAAQFNLEGNLLVTCGIKTIMVWDTTTGRVLHTYSNPKRMRAMAAAFSRDSSEILVCCVDSQLRRQLLSEPENWVQVNWQVQNEPALGRGGGTPIAVSFSPDGSKIVISHRTAPMTVWDTETGNLIGRSEGRRGRKITRNDNVDYPIKLTWNPMTEHVLGTFNNGTVFKWYPLDLHHEEMEDSVVATEIACSPDGRLMVTGQRDGSLKIFSFETFTLLFNLTCMTRASSIAISPDGRRIYDLRESFCSVWEPNALIRMAEQDEKSNSDTASSQYDGSVTISLASEATAVILEPVTALSADAAGTVLVFGNGGGMVKILRPGTQENVDIRCGLLGITYLVISDDGLLVAASSMDRKVSVLKTSTDGELEKAPIFETKSENPVVQLLFDGSGEYLMVKCEKFVNIWSLSSKALVSCKQNGSEPCYWMSHPFRKQSFVSIGPSAIAYQGLSDVTPTQQWSIDDSDIDEDSADSDPSITLSRHLASSYLTTPSDTEMSVDKVILAPNRSTILRQISKASSVPGRRETQYTLLDGSFISSDSLPPTTDSIKARPLPKPILSLLEVALGFVVDNVDARGVSREVAPTGLSTQTAQHYSLAFIDRDFWVRTWSLDDVEGISSKRHFFLPRDWINMDCLGIARVTHDGRFLCPRNGELAVVHNALREPGEIN